MFQKFIAYLKEVWADAESMMDDKVEEIKKEKITEKSKSPVKPQPRKKNIKTKSKINSHVGTGYKGQGSINTDTHVYNKPRR